MMIYSFFTVKVEYLISFDFLVCMFKSLVPYHIEENASILYSLHAFPRN